MNLSSLIISTAALLLSGLAAEQQQVNSNYGPFSLAKGGFQDVVAHADNGFYAFSFGGPKSYSYQSFFVKLHKTAFLSITDCYCPGDTFQVFDNGVPLLVTMNPEDGPYACEIPYYLTDAWSCFVGAYHSKGSAILNPGYHNITIATINSHLGGGTGFLRIDTSCTPTNEQPVPCCWIKEADQEQTDYSYQCGRLCNQMVNYP